MRPTIFYRCHDHNRPTGGQKDTYQHVDVLNRNGCEAYVVHRDKGFRVTWFENATPVIDGATFIDMFNTDDDLLVLPEDLGPAISRYPGRKIIFNKNVYYGAEAMLGAAADPYRSIDVISMFAVSEHNARYLRLAYPEKPVFLLPYDLRPAAFPYRPLRDKRPHIAWVPKALRQVAVLQQMLRARAASGRNCLGTFKWIPLTGMTESQIAAALSDALIVISLSVEEGLPRLPLEAMSAGCIVAAYASGPLRECLPDGYGFEAGDLEGVVAFIEDICAHYPALDTFESMVARGRQAAERFTTARQTEAVLAAWDAIISGLPRGARAAVAPALG